MKWIIVALVLGTIGLLMARKASRYVWTAALGVGLLAWGLLQTPPPWMLVPVWSLYLLLAALLTISSLRRQLLIRPALAQYGKIMPRMSETERAALDAGTVWWEAELFGGCPDWHRLLGFRAPKLSDEERAFIEGPTEQLCAMISDWEITEELRDLTPETWAFMKEQGFFGMIIPKQYGGLEFSAYAHSAVVMKVASRSISAGVTVMVPNSLGPAKLLLAYGTEEQKNHYLPRLARGQEIPCFALTGPEAGSDAAAMPDNGVVCRQAYQGQPDVLGIRLNWEKRYITLGPLATLLGLAFRLYDPDHLLGENEDIGITLALIPTDTPGIEIGLRHFPMSQSFMNGPNRGTDVFIPMDRIIGGRDHVGQGWRMLMNSLSDGRAISLPALSTASGKLMCRAVGAYAAVRKQFKIPIGKFEGISEVLARIVGNTYVMNAARDFTCAALDSGEDPSVASAIMKYHMTERMRLVVNDAMDILGGRGISMGPRNFVGRSYQALPIGITVEGANILTRNLIIFGQGAIRCHPFLLRQMEAAARGDVAAFDEALLGHGSLLMSNLVRSLFHGLTRGRLLEAPQHGIRGHYYRQFARMCLAFAVLTEVTLLSLGGTLKRRESLSGRLGDILSLLYLGSAVLKHHNDHGSPDDELPLLEWTCTDLLYNIQSRLDEVLDNFPVRLASRIARLLIFPLGRPYKRPGDTLGKHLAEIVLRPGPLRDRLTEGVYIPDGDNEPVAQLDDALNKSITAEPATRKLRQAMQRGLLPNGDPEHFIEEGVAGGVITQAEAEDIRSAVAARKLVIQVDEFLPEYLTKERTEWGQSTLDGVAGQSM
ncbi:MAG: acyl-CoA dehydrogenase [Gammaproteobacteria bacterium]|jgi:acyl-CoA dehydrogenase